VRLGQGKLSGFWFFMQKQTVWGRIVRLGQGKLSGFWFFVQKQTV